MIRGGITKLSNELVSLSHRMDSGDLTFGDIRTSFDLLKHCSTRLSREVYAGLEGPPCLEMNRNMVIPTDDH